MNNNCQAMQRIKSYIVRTIVCMYMIQMKKTDEQNEGLNEVVLTKPNSSQTNDDMRVLNEVVLQKPNSSQTNDDKTDLNEVLLQKPNSSQSDDEKTDLNEVLYRNLIQAKRDDEKTDLNEVLLQKPNSSQSSECSIECCSAFCSTIYSSVSYKGVSPVINCSPGANYCPTSIEWRNALTCCKLVVSPAINYGPESFESCKAVNSSEPENINSNEIVLPKLNSGQKSKKKSTFLKRFLKAFNKFEYLSVYK